MMRLASGEVPTQRVFRMPRLITRLHELRLGRNCNLQDQVIQPRVDKHFGSSRDIRDAASTQYKYICTTYL